MTSATTRPTTATAYEPARPYRRGNAFGRVVRQLGVDTAYSLIGLPLAVASFTVLVTGLATGAGLLVVVAGVPIIAGTLLAARVFANLHRLGLRGVLRRDSPRPRYRRSGAERGWFGKMFAPMRDAQSWLDLTAGVVDLPMAILAFSVAVTWWSLAISGLTSVLWEWAVPRGDNSSVAGFLGIADTVTNRVILDTAIGVVALLTLPLVVRLVALARARVARPLLCGMAEMRQQIAGLEERNAGLADQKQAAASAEATALRRLERDIHDGPQQRLVRLAMDLGRAKQQLDTDPAAARATIDEALGQTRETLDELRALSRGIAPPILTDRGLASALAALAGRNPVPVDLAVASDLGRLDPAVETTIYFVAAEALTNVAKHAGASRCAVTVARGTDRVAIAVADDGVGGASLAKGHGLAGLADRVRANGGTLTITSPASGPTEVRAEIPCG